MRCSTALLVAVQLFASFLTVTSLPSDEKWEKEKFDNEALNDEEKERLAAVVAMQQEMKYYHEQGGDDILGHYDSRFFKDVLSYDEKRHVQLDMIRSYLTTFRELGLETWIAHGTLLGWWWNGKELPWDWDIDTQVTEQTLYTLAEKHNATMHTYHSPISDDRKHSVERKYLLDINRDYKNRVRGDGFNIIDARWIDVDNGLYIDITGLSEVYGTAGVVACKNDHQYHEEDLFPLRTTVYEGVEAKVPYAYEELLREEYGPESLVKTEFEGHEWRQDVQEWVKLEGPNQKPVEEHKT